MNKLAFTLSEVLITLGIIGVVAAFTIPTLMNNINDMDYKIAYKKAFSDAQNAMKMIVADNNTVYRNGWISDMSNETTFSNFMDKFKTVKTCSYPNLGDCWSQSRTYDGWWANSHSFVDSSGRMWISNMYWGYIWVDTNGLKNPNQVGKDIVFFWLCPSKNLTQDSNSVCQNAGDLDIVVPVSDITNPGDARAPGWCAKVPCYYTSWLYN